MPTGSQKKSYVGGPEAARHLDQVNQMGQRVQTLQVKLGATGAAAGDLAAVANPTGTKCVVVGVVVDLTTIATGAATVDIGVAANATTSADNLIDGLDTHSATGIFTNGVNPGSNGKLFKPWAASEYVTASEASGDTTGQVGKITILYIDLEA
jgi:hypothetical protein